MSREHIEVEFTFEPFIEADGRQFVLASYDARAEVEAQKAIICRWLSGAPPIAARKIAEAA